MNPQLTFVTRLRRTRQRSRITLEQIAVKTRVKRELLEAFDENDLTDWPRGLYARAWVRGYAEMVGLDPEDTVDEFCRLYLHGDRRARSTMHELASLSEERPGYRDEHGFEERRKSLRREAAAQRLWYAPFVQIWRALRTRCVTLWESMFAKPGRAGRTL
jgi:cytoskeletal protein RodZ